MSLLMLKAVKAKTHEPFIASIAGLAS